MTKRILILIAPMETPSMTACQYVALKRYQRTGDGTAGLHLEKIWV
jgi:hypothetical protein